jgi:hypothetical protein
MEGFCSFIDNVQERNHDDPLGIYSKRKLHEHEEDVSVEPVSEGYMEEDNINDLLRITKDPNGDGYVLHLHTSIQ